MKDDRRDTIVLIGLLVTICCLTAVAGLPVSGAGQQRGAKIAGAPPKALGDVPELTDINLPASELQTMIERYSADRSVLNRSFPVESSAARRNRLKDNLALRMGALGAKVTGGGRGGYMNALTTGREMQEAIASAMEAEGYKVIRTTIGV